MSRIISEGGPFTDCIVAASVTSNTADFFSKSGLTLTVTASTASPFVYEIGGRRFMLTANLNGTATNTAHNFWWIDDTQTLGNSAYPCSYRWTAPSSPATDQHWFDLGAAQMKRYNGSAWVDVNRVFIGYTRADSGTQNAQHACEQIGCSPWWRFHNLGDAADGFLDLSSGTTTIDVQYRYAAVVLRSTATLTHTAGVSGLTQLKSQGVFILLDSSIIDLNGRGRAGGAGGTGVGGTGSLSGMAGGGGGGGGGSSGAGGTGGARQLAVTHGSGNAASGGAVGAVGGSGGSAGLGTTSPMPGAMGLMWTHGAGGGGGGGTGAAAGGAAGAGGGGMVISAAVIGWASGTSMTANGANGTAGGGSGRGGGGGGGGGALIRYARGLYNNGTESANGGTGGAAGGGTSGAGGPGGAGLLQFTRI